MADLPDYQSDSDTADTVLYSPDAAPSETEVGEDALAALLRTPVLAPTPEWQVDEIGVIWSPSASPRWSSSEASCDEHEVEEGCARSMSPELDVSSLRKAINAEEDCVDGHYPAVIPMGKCIHTSNQR